MIVEVDTAFIVTSATRLIGSGTIVAATLNIFSTDSNDVVARALLSFSSSNNPSGAPLGGIISDSLSVLSSARFDGRQSMLPDMQLQLTVNADSPCKVSASILVEHDRPDNPVKLPILP